MKGHLRLMLLPLAASLPPIFTQLWVPHPTYACCRCDSTYNPKNCAEPQRHPLRYGLWYFANAVVSAMVALHFCSSRLLHPVSPGIVTISLV